MAGHLVNPGFPAGAGSREEGFTSLLSLPLWRAHGRTSPCPCGPTAASVLSSLPNAAPSHLVPLQVAAGRPRSLADPAAEKPSPRPRAWRLGTGHPLSPQCTRRETATAGRRSPTACGRTGPRPQVGTRWGQGWARRAPRHWAVNAAGALNAERLLRAELRLGPVLWKRCPGAWAAEPGSRTIRMLLPGAQAEEKGVVGAGQITWAWWAIQGSLDFL